MRRGRREAAPGLGNLTPKRWIADEKRRRRDCQWNSAYCAENANCLLTFSAGVYIIGVQTCFACEAHLLAEGRATGRSPISDYRADGSARVSADSHSSQLFTTRRSGAHRCRAVALRAEAIRRRIVPATCPQIIAERSCKNVKRSTSTWPSFIDSGRFQRHLWASPVAAPGWELI